MPGKRVDEQARPADRGHTQLAIGLGADRIVDLGHHLRDVERLGRQLRRQDVAVVTLGQREEHVGAVGAGAAQDVLVGAVAADGLTGEVLFETVKASVLMSMTVTLVPLAREPLGNAGANPPAADDDYAHQRRATTAALGGAIWACSMPRERRSSLMATGSRSSTTSHGAFSSTYGTTVPSVKSPPKRFR